MKVIKTFLVAVSVLLLSGPLNAQANIIYDWTGDCQRILFGSNTLCTHATLHVVATDAYVPGDLAFRQLPPAQSPLLEWRYTDDNGADLDYAPNWSFGGSSFMLPALLPSESGPGEGSLSDSVSYFFNIHADGTWRIESEGLAPNCDEANPPQGNQFCGYGVVGTNGVWTRVPEPATLVLLGVSIVGLVLLRRCSK